MNKPLFHKVKQPFNMSMINSPSVGYSCTSLKGWWGGDWRLDLRRRGRAWRHRGLLGVLNPLTTSNKSIITGRKRERMHAAVT